MFEKFKDFKTELENINNAKTYIFARELYIIYEYSKKVKEDFGKKIFIYKDKKSLNLEFFLFEQEKTKDNIYSILKLELLYENSEILTKTNAFYESKFIWFIMNRNLNFDNKIYTPAETIILNIQNLTFKHDNEIFFEIDDSFSWIKPILEQYDNEKIYSNVLYHLLNDEKNNKSKTNNKNKI